MVYRYLIDTTYGTKDWMPEEEIINEYGSVGAFQDYLYTNAEALVPPKIVEAFAEQDIVVTFVSLESLQIAWERSGFWDGGTVTYKRKVYFIVSCFIESDSDFFGSPIAPLVIVAIGLAIALIVAAIVVPILFFNWLETTSTKEWEVTKWDWIPSPLSEADCVSDAEVERYWDGQQCWEYRVVQEERGREPSWEGIIALGISAALVIGAALLALR